MKRKRTVALVVVGLAAILAAQRWRSGQEKPIFTTGSDVPDARKAGGVDGTLRRAEELLTAYREAGWDLQHVPYDTQMRLLFLPDQKFAEDPFQRKPQVSAWCFPTEQKEYSAIAFYTDIYARRNHSHYRGGGYEAHPSGFFILAWKDGRIEKIPVDRLRTVQTATDNILVFPGMKEWEKGTPDPIWQEAKR